CTKDTLWKNCTQPYGTATSKWPLRRQVPGFLRLLSIMLPRRRRRHADQNGRDGATCVVLPLNASYLDGTRNRDNYTFSQSASATRPRALPGAPRHHTGRFRCWDCANIPLDTAPPK